MLLSAMVSRGEGGRGHDTVVQSRDKPLTVTHWLRIHSIRLVDFGVRIF